MLISQKTHYGLLAVLELAKKDGSGPIRAIEISEAQSIPYRFLETILSQLKHKGVVDSRRGKHGGYFLTRSLKELTVEDIVDVLQGPINPTNCSRVDGEESFGCNTHGQCALTPLWRKTREMISDMYRSTTFLSLVQEEKIGREGMVDGQ